VTETFTEYWGDVHTITPQCLTRKFLHMETVTLGWDSPLLHQNVCSVATFDQNPGGDNFLIKNKIIFAHSLGNLILASAIHNNICGIDLNTTSWYSITKPANGTIVANKLPEACSDPGIENQIAVLDGICINGKPGQAYFTIEPSYPGLSNLYPIFETHVTGGMCGISAGGLVSVYAPALALISKLSNLQSPNDGLVWYESCFVRLPGITPLKIPSAKYYDASINHADATCRNGDGWWGDDRKPCTWYTNKV